MTGESIASFSESSVARSNKYYVKNKGNMKEIMPTNSAKVQRNALFSTHNFKRFLHLGPNLKSFKRSIIINNSTVAKRSDSCKYE